MNIPEFVRSRLDPWYSTPPKEGAQSTLFTVCEKMVADAVAEKDKEIASLHSSRDNLQDIVRQVASLAQRDQNKETVVGAVERLVKQIADLKQARDDAVEAAKLIARESL